MQTGHETVKQSYSELLQPEGVFDVRTQETCPRVNNSCTAGEPFCRLGPSGRCSFLVREPGAIAMGLSPRAQLNQLNSHGDALSVG